MPRRVQKYGGAALADIAAIHGVARKIQASWLMNRELAVVVSAMYGETNRLIELAHQITAEPDVRELDVLLATGEQSAVALLTMVLKSLNVPAVSLLSHQIKVHTDSGYSRARIQEIDPTVILSLWSAGKLPVVAGFQGVDAQGNLTTLGRGGSDLTAVALAHALGADACEVYKDVDGVFTADPDICRDASLIARISYEEMLELASSGAQVLQTRAVSYARNAGVTIAVKPFGNPQSPGTIVTSEDKTMEQSKVSAVTIDKNEAKIGIGKLPDQPGIAAEIFSPLAAREIVVDMIVQNMNDQGTTALSFTVPKDQADLAYQVVKELAERRGWSEVVQDKKVAKVSAIGAGMRAHSGVAAQMFRALAREGINILMIGTSEIRISCLIEEKYAELALQTLHESFGLGKNATVIKNADAPKSAVL